MALEDVQAVHNSVLSNKHNVDGSNEATAQIKRGAEVEAARITLGLSEEEALALTSRQYRRQALASGQMTRGDINRLQRQSQATLRTQDESTDIGGVGFQQEDPVDPFGQDQGQYATYQEGDKQYEEQEREKLKEELLSAYDRGDKEEISRLSKGLRLNPEDRPEVAPTSVIRDALRQVEASAAQEAPMQAALAAVMGPGGGNADLEKAKLDLQQHLTSGKAEDARLGRVAVRRDRARFDPEVRAYNDFRAEAESQRIARDQFTAGGRGSTADDAIGRIAEIRSLGKVGETAQVIRTANNEVLGDAVRRNDGVYIDPRSGLPIAVQEDALQPALQGGNSPSTANQLNAPQTGRQWVAETRPDYREGGRTFGDFPQVDTTLEATNFANRANDYVKGELLIQPPRTIAEFEGAVDQILATASERGDTMYDFDPETGKNVATSTPGFGAAMNKLRYNESGMERMANALFQLDAAQRSSVNQNQKATFANRTGGPTQDVFFDAKEAINPSEGAAPIAQQRKGTSIRVGTERDSRGRPKAVRQDVRTAIQGLPGGPSVSKPYIGAVAGEEKPVGRQVFQGRSPMEQRERRMAQLKTNAAKRRREGKPMTRQEQADAIGKLRLQQVQNVVAQARADQAAAAQREKDKAVTDRGRLTATPPGMPPAEPGPMRQPEPARTPTGSTTSGDSYYADRAREQYSRRKGAEVAEDSQVIKQLAEIVARRRALG